MRMNFKSISVLAAFMMLVMSLFAFPVSAADVSYSASTVSGTTGDTVTVSVSMSSSVELWAGNVSLGYNSSELQVVDKKLGSASSSGSSLYDSGSSVNFSGMYSAKSGTVFTVSFKILKESGSSVLALSTSENTDYNGVVYTASASNGAVNVVNKQTAEKITLSKSSVTLKKGETTKITAAASPDSFTSKIGFYSSDDDIATVDSDGTITAVGGGTATITAFVGDVTAKCTVTVSVPMTGIKANGSTTRTVKVGEKVSLSVSKVPTDATDKVTATWSSSNPEIASVKAGNVTAVAVGEATITAKVNSYSVAFKIVVTEATGETTTQESTTAGESMTDESTTDESATVDESTTETPVTFPTTEPYSETTTLEAYKVIEPTTYNSNDNGIKGTREYTILMLIAAAGVAAVVVGAVTFFVSRGYKGKNKKQKIIVEEKYKR